VGGGGRAERAARGDADDPVDDEVDLGQLGHDPTARPAERGQARRVRAVGVEQDGAHGHAPTPEEVPGPQGVTAVAARPDQQTDPPAAFEEFQRDRGHPEGGAPHERALRGPGQQPVLGRLDVFGVPETAHATSLGRLIRP
jgi:hypothetical protein